MHPRFARLSDGDGAQHIKNENEIDENSPLVGIGGVGRGESHSVLACLEEDENRSHY